MILPNKYITLDESYIGIAAYTLNALGDKSLLIDDLWAKFQIQYENKKQFLPSYIKFSYVVMFMYFYGMISYNERGEIFNENLKSADS